MEVCYHPHSTSFFITVLLVFGYFWTLWIIYLRFNEWLFIKLSSVFLKSSILLWARLTFLILIVSIIAFESFSQGLLLSCENFLVSPFALLLSLLSNISRPSGSSSSLNLTTFSDRNDLIRLFTIIGNPLASLKEFYSSIMFFSFLVRLNRIEQCVFLKLKKFCSFSGVSK